MKKRLSIVAIGCACAGLLSAHPIDAAPEEGGVADALKRLEQAYGDAIQAADTTRLDQILDDDWTELTSTAGILKKRELLDDLASGKYRLESFEMGPMYVKVLGDIAVVQGSASEKRILDGKEGSRRSVWMDVFAKRGDGWVVVRSQTATAK
jgi:ketosteroid isomerase-like protein